MTSQEELDLQICRSWVLPGRIRTRLETSDLESYRKIAAMNPDDIITRANKIMEYWTGDKMDSYMGADYYNTRKLSGEEQLRWTYTDDFEEVETCLQVYRLFKRIGVEITLQQAHFIWAFISDYICAQWLCKDDDESCWSAILANFLFNQPIEVETLLNTN